MYLCDKLNKASKNTFMRSHYIVKTYFADRTLAYITGKRSTILFKYERIEQLNVVHRIFKKVFEASLVSTFVSHTSSHRDWFVDLRTRVCVCT